MSQPCQTLPLEMRLSQLKTCFAGAPATPNGHYAAYAFYVDELCHFLMDLYSRLAVTTGATIDEESLIAQMIGLDAGSVKVADEHANGGPSWPIALNDVSHAFNLLVCAEHHLSEYTKAMQGLLDPQGPARSG